MNIYGKRNINGIIRALIMLNKNRYCIRYLMLSNRRRFLCNEQFDRAYSKKLGKRIDNDF